MVFENLTLIELNVGDAHAQFGPGAAGSSEAPEGSTESDTYHESDSSGGGRSPLRLLAVGLVASLVVALLARRFFGSDGDGGIEIGDDDGIEIGDGDVEPTAEN